jgi:hypothetical protein
MATKNSTAVLSHCVRGLPAVHVDMNKNKISYNFLVFLIKSAIQTRITHQYEACL